MKLDRSPHVVWLAAAVALSVAAGSSPRALAQVPPPPPPVPGATPAPGQSAPAATPLPSAVPVPTATPTATPAPRGRKRARPTPNPSASANPEPSATPTSPAFATLDGSWEMQLQYIDHTEYSYLDIHQIGTSAISGAWRVGKTAAYPFEGTYDGRLIRLVAKGPDGNVTFSGYVEGASDMVGTVDFGKKGDPPPFTAEHRGSPKGSIFKKGL